MKERFTLVLAVSLVFSSLASPRAAQSQQPPSASPQNEQARPAKAARPDAAQQQEESYEDEVVRITANLVQLDAVVLDREGRQVTDLKAEDFQLLVDGKPQPITNLSYISTQPVQPPPAPRVPDAVRAAPPPPPQPLKRSQVRRTLALVVDDLGLSFESTAFVRKALKRFVDEQMQPGDMAAIIRTSAGVGALQQFTYDKQVLYAAIDRVRWYPLGQGGVSAFSPIQSDPFGSLARSVGGRNQNAAGVTERAGQTAEQQAAELNQFREELFSVGTLGALNFVVRGLKELPGRKSVVLFSDGIRLFNPVPTRDREREDVPSSGGNQQTGMPEPGVGIKGDAPDFRENNRVIEALRRLTDLANRASVVIYTIDARGLQTLSLNAQDNVADTPIGSLQKRLADRRNDFYDTQEGLIYLARLTGGFAAQNSNDLNKSIGRVLDEQKGYYLIGYRPDPETFDPSKGRHQFHSLTLNVKRPGLRVRARMGFYGVPEDEARPSRRTPAEQLAAALTSPFTSGQLGLRLTALFGNDARTGSVVRSVLHIDARDLTFKPDAEGWQKADLDIIAFAYGDNGQIIRQHSFHDQISLKADAYRSALDNGIVYSLDVPVRKAGAYQLRVAVRDAASERIGSANQLVQVPNLNENRLALSGIYLSGRRLKRASAGVGGASNASGAQPSSSAANNSNAASDGAHGAANSRPQTIAKPAPAPSEFVLANMEEEAEPDPQAVPAVRRFRRGMMLSYIYVIHNARLDKATGRPQLQTQTRLFRDGQLVYEGRVTPVSPESQADMTRIYTGGRLYLGTNLQPGEYVLQVVVNDPLAPENRRTATQWMDFEIVTGDK